MYLVHVHLANPDRPHPTEADAHLIHDALWAHATPDTGLEHIRARPGPRGIDLVLFLSHDIPDPDPTRYATGFVDLAVEKSPVLRRWQQPIPTNPRT